MASRKSNQHSSPALIQPAVVDEVEATCRWETITEQFSAQLKRFHQPELGDGFELGFCLRALRMGPPLFVHSTLRTWESQLQRIHELLCKIKTTSVAAQRDSLAAVAKMMRNHKSLTSRFESHARLVETAKRLITQNCPARLWLDLGMEFGALCVRTQAESKDTKNGQPVSLNIGPLVAVINRLPRDRLRVMHALRILMRNCPEAPDAQARLVGEAAGSAEYIPTLDDSWKRWLIFRNLWTIASRTLEELRRPFCAESLLFDVDWHLTGTTPSTSTMTSAGYLGLEFNDDDNSVKSQRGRKKLGPAQYVILRCLADAAGRPVLSKTLADALKRGRHATSSIRPTISKLRPKAEQLGVRIESELHDGYWLVPIEVES